MKTLSIEQMKHLRGLGVYTFNASMVLIFEKDDGNFIPWEVRKNEKNGEYECYNERFEEWEIVYPRLYDAETGDYYYPYKDNCGVFTLQDIIEILPKIDKYIIVFDENKINYCGKSNFLRLSHFNDNTFDMITSAYNLLIWTCENGYYKGLK